MRDQKVCFKLQEGLRDVVPCAIRCKINICCYFSKPESDVKPFFGGIVAQRKILLFLSSLLTKVAIFYARKTRRFWRGLKHC